MMKKLAIILTAFTLVAFSAQAQTKGPKYKNAAPSEKYDGKKTVWLAENPSELKGPAKKNYKPGKAVYAESATEQADGKVVFASIDINERKGINDLGLKGPRYKNKKRFN